MYITKGEFLFEDLKVSRRINTLSSCEGVLAVEQINDMEDRLRLVDPLGNKVVVV